MLAYTIEYLHLLEDILLLSLGAVDFEDIES
jgi:hypothetical protein